MEGATNAVERLCRYVARPPIAQELDLIARLCALIPPPRFHMLRYHGVLAAHARIRLGLFSALAEARPEVVPGPVSVPTEQGAGKPTVEPPPAVLRALLRLACITGRRGWSRRN